MPRPLFADADSEFYDGGPRDQVRIALVTDIHATRGHRQEQPKHRARFDAVISAVNDANPDLILLAGDLTEESRPEEIDDFKNQVRGLRAPTLRVLGNHDVGNKRTGRFDPRGVCATRISRCENQLAPSYFAAYRCGLRIVGLNSLLLGSGLPREAEQWRFLESVLSRPTDIVLMHQPLFLDRPKEGDATYWNVAPDPRGRLMSLINKSKARAVLSGHMHYAIENRIENTLYYTSPAVAFGMPRNQPCACGWTMLTLSRYGVHPEFQSINL